MRQKLITGPVVGPAQPNLPGVDQPSSVATRGGVEDLRPQLQCRMKRCGQFWSTAGDEALLGLEGFWPNDRWHLLFPHAILTSVANN